MYDGPRIAAEFLIGIASFAFMGCATVNNYSMKRETPQVNVWGGRSVKFQNAVFGKSNTATQFGLFWLAPFLWNKQVTEDPLRAKFHVVLLDDKGAPLSGMSVRVIAPAGDGKDEQVSDKGYLDIDISAPVQTDPLAALSVPIKLQMPEWEQKFEQTGEAAVYSPKEISFSLFCLEAKCELIDARFRPLDTLTFQITVTSKIDPKRIAAYKVELAGEERRKAEILAETQKEEEATSRELARQARALAHKLGSHSCKEAYSEWKDVQEMDGTSILGGARLSLVDLMALCTSNDNCIEKCSVERCGEQSVPMLASIVNNCENIKAQFRQLMGQ